VNKDIGSLERKELSIRGVELTKRVRKKEGKVRLRFEQDDEVEEVTCSIM
jgi:hypothetical protein